MDKNLREELLKPFWEGNRVLFESAMLVGEGDGAPLIFTPDKIEGVYNMARDVRYEEGVDYEVGDGKIYPTATTRMPVTPPEEYYLYAPARYMEDGEEKELAIGVVNERVREYFPVEGERYFTFSNKKYFYDRQISISYTHSDAWGGYIPENHSEIYAPFFEKARAGECPTIVWFGDSITTGCDASGEHKDALAPYQPSFPTLIREHIENNYGRINYVNTAVGGKNTLWAQKELEERALKYDPDLLVLAFGMNDKLLDPEDFYKAYKEMLCRVYERSPEVRVLLIGTMIPNPWSNWHLNQPRHTEKLHKLAGEFKNIAVCDMTRLSQDIYATGKRFRDVNANNVNHPGDFLARVYAQAILRVIEK